MIPKVKQIPVTITETYHKLKTIMTTADIA